MSNTTHSVAGLARTGPVRFTAVALAAVLAAQVPACDNEEDDSGPGARAFVTDVQLLDGDASAILHEEPLPAGSADGPALTVDGEATVINGGSLQVSVESTAEFDRLLVGVQTVEQPDATSPAPAAPGPLTGYYEIATGELVTSAVLVLTMAQALPATSFLFDFAAVGTDGSQGATSQQSASVVEVGAGDVQVSVSWDAASDVDLHVVDPAGDEIYYGEPSAASGGTLDLDSNASCTLDNTNNENITFSDAPPGNYTVRVDYWSSCDEAQTEYVVTVQVAGQPPQVFEGTFTGGGDSGGLGDGEEITTFTVGE
jgi:uncharacterized protein YfaP (DUF2135 family)